MATTRGIGLRQAARELNKPCWDAAMSDAIMLETEENIE
jgi:hypothetical protein